MRIKTLAWTLLTAVLGTTLLAAQQPGTGKVSSRSALASANYGKLPLSFEANLGQSAGQVKFLSRGKGYTAFLTTGGMVLALRPTQAANKSAVSSQPANATLQFRLVGGNKNPAAVGEDQQPGRVNYFLGNEPAKWHRNVPSYAKVRYKNVYPGIDLVYYGNHQQLEYDFAIAAGADPSRIQFEIQGSEQIALDGEGDLVLSMGNGDVHFKSPMVYQESNGTRVAVEGSYVVKDSTHVGFAVAHYDSSKALVIDPVLQYSTYLGGSGSDQPAGIAVDAAGNAYIAGYTDSADFPLAASGALAGNANHVFVAKLDPAGSHLIYADYIGGSSQDYGVALALDSANNVYVTGATQSNNFPVVNPLQAQQPGPYSGFVSKLSADGSSLLYSTYLGGNAFDQPTSLAVDSLGHVHVAGYTMSQNFPTANAFQSVAAANQGGVFGNYGFLTTLSADGTSLIYSTYVGGNSNVVQDCGTPCWPTPYNVISSVAVDSNGNAYIAGITNTYNFPVTQGSYLPSNSTPQDANVGFVSKFNSAGSLAYSTYFYGSSGNPVGIGAIAVDGSGSAYVTGVANSDGTFPVTSTSICDPGTYGFGCSYGFVAKFDAIGSSLLYSTFLGPNNYASPQSIAVDAAGSAYVLASTSSGLLEMINSIEPYSGGRDSLLVQIDPSGTSELFATYLGGSGNDSPAGLALDAKGNIYVVGSTDSADFPTTQGAFQGVMGGRTDAFVVKISPASASSVALSPSALQYSTRIVGSVSPAQQVLLRNLGSAPLSITSITASGDFAESDTCGNSVPAAGSCTFSITFTPTASGSRSGSITIQDDGSGSPQFITLAGIGSSPSPTVALTPTGLTFSSVPVGVSAAAQSATLINTSSVPLSVANIQVSGDFQQSNNCPATLPAVSSCNINVVFTPTTTGNRSGTLTVSDNAQVSSQSVSLTGAGSDFDLDSSTSQTTIKAGAKATYTLSISPVGGAFSSAVSLNCSGLPAKATCSFSPGTITPGSNGASTTLTITTADLSADAAPAQPAAAHSSPSRAFSAMWIQFQGFGLLGMVVAGGRKRNKRLLIAMLLLLLLLGMMFTTGCGGTGIVPQQSQTGTTYTVMVTGTSGGLQHTLPLTLTVQ